MRGACLALWSVFSCAIADGTAGAQTVSIAPVATLQARRTHAMEMAGSGILLVRSTSTVMNENQTDLRQDPTFLYLTGLPNAVAAVLAIDIDRHETWLFVPDAGRLPGFGAVMRAPYAYVTTGAASATALGIDHVVSWRELEGFLDRRITQDSALVLRGPFTAISAPALHPAILAGSDAAGLWEQTLRARWPRVKLAEGPDEDELREVKQPGEIAALRTVATSSASALIAGLQALRPGRRQREAEIDVLASCVRHGADGVSFWPWLMTGVNADIISAAQSLGDAGFRDRVMQAGELARVDVGCRQAHYAGDVGRTAPVSGRFTADQREAWELFVGAYRVAVRAMQPGIPASDIFVVWRGEIQRRRRGLRSRLARRTAEVALSSDGGRFWEIHGVGLASAEGNVDTLRVGQVLAFEPILTVDGVGLYLEDMILITADGAELLTRGLPYTADEIEAVMRARPAVRAARANPRHPSRNSAFTTGRTRPP